MQGVSDRPVKKKNKKNMQIKRMKKNVNFIRKLNNLRNILILANSKKSNF